MKENVPSCFKCVGRTKICNIYQEKAIRHGYTKSGVIGYKCNTCGKAQVKSYTYKATILT